MVDATGVALSITHSRSHGEYSMRVEGAPGNYAVVTDALGRVVSASNSLMNMVPGLGPAGLCALTLLLRGLLQQVSSLLSVLRVLGHRGAWYNQNFVFPLFWVPAITYREAIAPLLLLIFRLLLRCLRTVRIWRFSLGCPFLS